MSDKANFYPVINYVQCEECYNKFRCECQKKAARAWLWSFGELKIYPAQCIKCEECVKRCIASIKAIQILLIGAENMEKISVDHISDTMKKI